MNKPCWLCNKQFKTYTEKARTRFCLDCLYELLSGINPYNIMTDWEWDRDLVIGDYKIIKPESSNNQALKKLCDCIEANEYCRYHIELLKRFNLFQ